MEAMKFAIDDTCTFSHGCI